MEAAEVSHPRRRELAAELIASVTLTGSTAYGGVPGVEIVWRSPAELLWTRPTSDAL
jgi:hypothetical protein